MSEDKENKTENKSFNIKKERFIFLIIGGVVGIVLGGAIVKYQSDYFSKQKGLGEIVVYVKNVFTEKGYLPSVCKFQTTFDLLLVKRRNQNEKYFASNSHDVISLNRDTTTYYYWVYETSISNQDSLNSEDRYDNDKLTYKLSEIKKDELLYVKEIVVEEEKANLLDSLVEITGKSNILTIEFWISPINYKGYKFNKSKLVLFGLNPTDNIAVKKIDNEYYLKYLDLYYKLVITDNFRSYQMIVDENKIKKFR